MDSTRTRHHWGPNLAQYHYVEKKYGRKARAQVFWATTGLIVLLVGSLVVAQISETDAQRKARFLENEAAFVRIACKFGERACAWAKENSRSVICHEYPEGCSSK